MMKTQCPVPWSNPFRFHRACVHFTLTPKSQIDISKTHRSLTRLWSNQSWLINNFIRLSVMANAQWEVVCYGKWAFRCSIWVRSWRLLTFACGVSRCAVVKIVSAYQSGAIAIGWCRHSILFFGQVQSDVLMAKAIVKGFLSTQMIIARGWLTNDSLAIAFSTICSTILFFQTINFRNYCKNITWNASHILSFCKNSFKVLKEIFQVGFVV